MDYDELLRHLSDNKAANLHTLTPAKYADLQISLSRGLRVASFRADESRNAAILAAKSMLHTEVNNTDPLEQILDGLVSALRRKLVQVNPYPMSRSARRRVNNDNAYNEGIQYAISVFEKERRPNK